MREAIVLAGGYGTRLRAVVSNVPKPMAPVAGHPFLEILLTKLAQKGFSRIILSLGYMAETVVSYFGAKYKNMDLVYEIESTPLGTGGAVRQAMNRCLGEYVFVFNGDTFLDLEVTDVEANWLAHHTPIIVAREVPDTSRYGRLMVSANCVSGFSEKGMPGHGLINAGSYVLPVNLLNRFPLGQAFSLETGFLAEYVTLNRTDVFITHGHFIDIGIPDDYARAQTELEGVCD